MFDEWRATAPEMEEVAEQTVSVPGRPAAFAGADVVDYRTTVEDPRDNDDEIAVLELHGLYATASVEVPGDRLFGKGPVAHDAYFRPLRIPYEPTEGEELRVRCRAPEDRFGGLHNTDLVPEDQAVPGIWWDVSVEARPLPYVESMDVRPVVREDSATLSVRTTVVGDEALDDRITYSVRPAGDHKGRGMMERASVESTEPGRTVVEHTVEVHDPNLWWPRGMGDQHFYTLRGKIDDEETAVTTGLCDVARDGSELVVNGEPMHVRGVNLLTDSPEDVDRAIECNANLIRGHAQALPESVYERCDEAGMLVWQDLPLTGPGSFDTERGETLAAALGNQYGRHPSLAVVGIHDDPIDAFEDGLGSGLLDRMRLRYRAWRSNYDDQPARTLADAVTVDRPVIPVVGGPGVGADAGSYYPGWQYGHADTIDDLLDRYPVDIVAEFGAGALADTQGMQADEAAGFDASIHDRRVGGDVAASQAYQAEVIETVAGSLRRERVGAIALAIRDTDEAGMGVYGHDGTQKAGAETLASAYAPIRASVTDPAADESDIVVLNDRPRPLSTDITYIAGDEQGSFELTVNAQGRWRGGPITLPEDAEQVEIEIDLDGDTLAFEEEL